MTLIVLTIVVVALLIAALAVFLFMIGALLNRTADNLDDCAQNVKNIAYHAEAIGPGIKRINETGGTIVGALPLLVDGAERIGVAKGAPYVDPDEAPSPAPYSAPAPAPAPAAAPAPPVTRQAPSEAPVAVPAAVSADSPQGVGYLDQDGGGRGNLGYLDT
jgi:HAMP domain-containing protein